MLSNDLYKKAFEVAAENTIWVSASGCDTLPGNTMGSLETPYATVDAAVAAITSTKKHIMILPGTYQLTAAMSIMVSGVVIQGIGSVVLTGPVAGDHCFKTVFGATSGTKEITFKNITLNHKDDATQIGIFLTNTGATAKIICTLKDVVFGSTGGDSIHVVNLVNGQAIRTYCTGCTTEGPVNIVVKDDGDRFRFSYGNLRAGLVTDGGNYDAEILIAWSTFLYDGITGGHANQRVIFIASASETDAEPNVYLEALAASVTTQTPQILEFDVPGTLVN